MNRPRIVVTMGDPAGVGPEVCLDLLQDRDVVEACVPIVYGDVAVLEACAKATGKAGPPGVIDAADVSRADAPAVLDLGKIALDEFEPGTVNSVTGKASHAYITAAIDDALSNTVDAVTTAPINKAALHSAGVPHPGHTEIFAERTNAKRVCMLMTSDALTCSFVTLHVGLRDVPSLLSTERVFDVIELTRDAMQRIRGKEPKLVVCGLNPHAGEGGLFGQNEEERVIIPAIERARGDGCDIEGPLPPDTAFLERRRSETDAFVCMYHDQGLVPLKALAFDRAINVTLGLPIVRTSVDHGTALDIAWQGKAKPQSMKEAVLLAAKLC